MAISSTIKSIQDIMRKDVGVDGDAQRIGQLVWMLLLKIFDDREQEWEMLNDAYRSPIPEPLRWRNWAADPEGMTGDELKDFVDTMLSPGLQQLQPRGDAYASASTRWWRPTAASMPKPAAAGCSTACLRTGRVG